MESPRRPSISGYAGPGSLRTTSLKKSICTGEGCLTGTSTDRASTSSSASSTTAARQSRESGALGNATSSRAESSQIKQGRSAKFQATSLETDLRTKKAVLTRIRFRTRLSSRRPKSCQASVPPSSAAAAKLTLRSLWSPSWDMSQKEIILDTITTLQYLNLPSYTFILLMSRELKWDQREIKAGRHPSDRNIDAG